MNVMVVDDDERMRTLLGEFFKREHTVVVCEAGEQALERLKVEVFDLVVTDNNMPGMSGMDLLKKGIEISHNTTFLMITAFATIKDAVEAIKLGAEDYIVKPFSLEDLKARVLRIEKLRELKNRHALEDPGTGLSGSARLVGNSSCIKTAREFAKKVADVPSPVLLLGPTGTGKEVLAKAVHESGARAKHPFVAVNCANLDSQLLESELFGHEKGSFTGAQNTHQGRFELAGSGTIFLDEIGDMPLELQAKLLRVLEEKEFYRVGGERKIHSRARVLAATHRDLKKLCTEGRFRDDLYFRLNVLSFTFDPLSKRPEDVPALIEHHMAILSKELGRKSVLPDETLEVLAGYSWPGNIRELRNVLERLVVLGTQSPESPTSSSEICEIPFELLPHEVTDAPSGAILEANTFSGELNLEATLRKVQDEMIDKAMSKASGNQVKAAALLGVSRGKLQYILKQRTKPGA